MPEKISVEQIKKETADYLIMPVLKLEEKIKTCRQDRAKHWDANEFNSIHELQHNYITDEGLIYNLVDFQEWAYDVHFPSVEKFGKRVLDFGCGLGYTAEHFAANGHEVTIADVPTQAFSFAHSRMTMKKIDHKMILLETGMLQLKETYDTIICIDVIEHLVNPIEMLWHFYEHLSDGGILYITNLEAKHDDIHRDHIIYQPPQILEMMKLMGFQHIGGVMWKKIIL